MSKPFKVCRFDEWDDEKAQKVYAATWRPSWPTYEYWRNSFLKGYRTEVKTAAALEQKGCKVEWVDPDHDWLRSDHNYSRSPYQSFDIWLVAPNGQRFSMDIKSCRSDGNIHAWRNPYRPVDEEFFRQSIFHGADYLVTITDDGELRAANISCYAGQDEEGKCVFTTKPMHFERFTKEDH